MDQKIGEGKEGRYGGGDKSGRRERSENKGDRVIVLLRCYEGFI